jgi:hypothetical protein
MRDKQHAVELLNRLGYRQSTVTLRRLGMSVLVWLAVVAGSLLFSQTSSPIKGLERIPSDQREGLIRSLDQLVSLYRAKDWSGVYERLTRVPPAGETASQFAERLAGAYPRNVGKNLTAFQPESIVEQPASQWAVWGCATLKGNANQLTRERWMVIASSERGGWFFSELLPASQLDARKPMSCGGSVPKR